MRYGYVRVSTSHQDTARQEVLMKELGVDRVFIDKCTGKNTKRPMLKEMMDILQAGDVIVVESYSRMSRSTTDLLTIVEKNWEKWALVLSVRKKLSTLQTRWEECCLL